METWLYMLVCTLATNCPSKPIYASDLMYSERSCRETAPKMAMAMHYKQGGEWVWKCFKADYVPKEMN